MESSENGQGDFLEWGDSIRHPREDAEFTFTYNVRDFEHVLKVHITLPLQESREEFGYRLIASHHIPCYLHNDLFRSLGIFTQQKTEEFNKKVHSNLLESLKDRNTKPKLLNDWLTALSLKERKEGKVERQSIHLDTAWSDIYHALIHSSALEALLQLEHSYSVAMKDLVRQKNEELKDLQNRHVEEMEEMVTMVGTTKSDHDVNQLTAKQLEQSQMQEISWSSAISELQESQKREYRQWVATVHEKTVADESYNEFEAQINRHARSPSMESYQVNNYEVVNSPQDHFMEESFTIYLGNQMKSMHNIRLVCRDMLGFCQCKTLFVGGSMVPQPQRLQTAMTLYSENLSALILLVDDRFNSSYMIKNRFQDICNESTEFHFQNIDKQICMIEDNLQNRPNRTRTLRSSSQMRKPKPEKTTNLLQTGDFYITKHSNLSEVHAVFHLVTDDTVSTQTINSRHPIMVGVRNIMLASARHNITNLIIPLLLVHEMSENLTIQWCMKRAELVYKCVKGFMMESLSWDGNDSRTLQFVVPAGISEEMFAAFNGMLPNIFRVSTTLDLSKLTT